MSVAIKMEMNFDELGDLVNEIDLIGKNMKTVLNTCGIYMLRETHKRFEGQHDPWGRRWKPLSEYTLMMRRKGGKSNYGAAILRDTGFMWRSIVKKQSLTAYKLDENEVVIGTNVRYAWKHQEGGYMNKYPPQRMFLGINNEDETEIVRIFQDYVDKAFR